MVSAMRRRNSNRAAHTTTARRPGHATGCRARPPITIDLTSPRSPPRARHPPGVGAVASDRAIAAAKSNGGNAVASCSSPHAQWRPSQSRPSVACRPGDHCNSDTLKTWVEAGDAEKQAGYGGGGTRRESGCIVDYRMMDARLESACLSASASPIHHITPSSTTFVSS